MGQRAEVRSRHRRAEEESGERVRPASTADEVLELQRTAGNQAVTALLARAPVEAAPADAKAPAASGQRAVLPGIGTIALLSASLDQGRLAGGPGAGKGRRGEDGPQDVVLTSRPGKHTPDLAKAAREGTPMTVELVLGEKFKLVLEGAIVSGYTSSGQGDAVIESWTLNFRGMTVVGGQAEQEDGEAGARG